METNKEEEGLQLLFRKKPEALVSTMYEFKCCDSAFLTSVLQCVNMKGRQEKVTDLKPHYYHALLDASYISDQTMAFVREMPFNDHEVWFQRVKEL